MEANQQNYQEEELLKIAKNKVARLKDFYIHTFIFSIGVVIFVLKEYFGMSSNLFPINYINSFTMAIWAIIYLISALGMFFEYRVFGKKWEDNITKSILEKQSEKQIWK